MSPPHNQSHNVSSENRTLVFHGSQLKFYVVILTEISRRHEADHGVELVEIVLYWCARQNDAPVRLASTVSVVVREWS